MPMSIHFEGNPCRFSIVLLLCFVMFLKEHVNMVLLQESEKVNETSELEQNLRFV